MIGSVKCEKCDCFNYVSYDLIVLKETIYCEKCLNEISIDDKNTMKIYDVKKELC